MTDDANRHQNQNQNSNDQSGSTGPVAVKLSPSAFADDSGILDMTMEEAVSYTLDREKNRAKISKDNENEQVVIIGVRSVPSGLLMSLDTASHRLDVSKSLLTRCLSHHIIAWYNDMDRLKELSDLYYTACEAADDLGYPDLYDGVSTESGFTYANPAARGASFRSISWIQSSLSKIAQPLGITVGTAFTIGLCNSMLRTASGRSEGTRTKYLRVEVDRLERLIEERFISIFSFHNKVRRRAVEDGYTMPVTSRPLG